MNRDFLKKFICYVNNFTLFMTEFNSPIFYTTFNINFDFHELIIGKRREG